jgi:acetylglutamate kinase
MVKAEGLLVLKCSGKTLGDEVLGCVAQLEPAKHLAIVHGGGVQITDAMKALGMEVRFHDGYRVTDDMAMEVVEQELVKINRGLVGRLHAFGYDAAPFLYGVFFGDTIEDTGRYGRITRTECPEVMHALLKSRIAVLSPMGTDSCGGKLNLNADDAAVSAAIALGASEVILATDVDGIFADGELITEIKVSRLEGLMEARIISGGMIAKARACIQAAEAGVLVRIVNGNCSEAVQLALDGKDCGTTVLPE